MLSTMEQMYIDALELAIKMNYRVVIFTVDKYTTVNMRVNQQRFLEKD